MAVYVKRYYQLFWGIVIAALINVLASLAIPLYIGRAIDKMIGAGLVDFEAIKLSIIALVILVLVCATAQWLMSRFTNKVSHQIVYDLRTDALERLERVSLKSLDGLSHGEVIGRLSTDIEIISEGLLQGFSQLLSGGFLIIGTLVVMSIIQLQMMMLILVLTPITIFITTQITQRTYHYYKEQAALRGEVSSYVEERISNQLLVKGCAAESDMIADFEILNARLQVVGVQAQFSSALANPTTRLVNGFIYTAVTVFGGYLAVSGKISIGLMSALLTYSTQYMKPFNEITGVIAELQSALSSASRVFELIEMDIEIPEKVDMLPIDTENCRIEMQNVSFSYQKNKPVLRNLNFIAEPGKTIAIVGPTGCGKTTLINILMRFYDITDGEIYIGGKKRAEIQRSNLRKQFGMVLQDSWIFTGTIAQNIAYGKPDASMSEIVKASKQAHAHSFIEQLPKGYETQVNFEQNLLSEGQKQLLSIARVMLSNPPFLILDEATSNIDTRTEFQIQRAFKKMMVGKTCFIIAHRLATIKEADEILVMELGEIIERGTHADLLADGGFYAKLYNSQFRYQS